jgi:hypothetical protein
MTSDEWYDPIALSKYVCQDNGNHFAFGDIYYDSIVCPFCGGVMGCANPQELEYLGLSDGDQIPSKTQEPDGFIE